MSSGGASESLDEIDGVFKLALRLPGLTVDSSEFSLLVFGPSRVVVDSLGVGGMGESGRGRSSRENIDKSSPFHWSPR